MLDPRMHVALGWEFLAPEVVCVFARVRVCMHACLSSSQDRRHWGLRSTVAHSILR